VVEQFAAASVTLPSRRFVSNGAVAFDECEQLAVQVERIHVGGVGAETSAPVNCVVTRTAELAVWLTRCTPQMAEDGTPPSASEIDASAEDLLADAVLLSEAVITKRRDYAHFDGNRRDVGIAELRPIGPEGGQGGAVQRVRVQL
jgi:hypothetical protein